MMADVEKFGITTAVIFFRIIENANSSARNPKCPAIQPYFRPSLYCMFSRPISEMLNGFSDRFYLVRCERSKRNPETGRQDHAARVHTLFRDISEIII